MALIVLVDEILKALDEGKIVLGGGGGGVKLE